MHMQTFFICLNLIFFDIFDYIYIICMYMTLMKIVNKYVRVYKYLQLRINETKL